MIKVHVRGGAAGTLGFGAFNHAAATNTLANSTDSFVYPCSNFANSFFQSTRVRVNNTQLPSTTDYSVASTLYKIVTSGKDENDLMSNDISLESSHIPANVAGSNRADSAGRVDYIYDGLNKFAVEKIKKLLKRDEIGGSLPDSRNVNEFWVCGKLDCQLFNNDAIIGPNTKISVDLLIDSNFHFNVVQYTKKNGCFRDVAAEGANAEPISIVKDSNQTLTDNQFAISGSDLGMYVPTFMDDAIISSSLHLNSTNLFIHRRNLNTGTSADQFNINFPSPPKMIVIAFQDSRAYSQGYTPSYFGLQYDKDPASFANDVFNENCCQYLIQSCEVIYANKTLPAVRYNISNQKTSTSLEESYRAYYDTIHNSGLVERKNGSVLSFSAWRNSPIFCFRPQADETTSCVVTLQFNGQISANNVAVVLGCYDESLELSYDSNGMITETIVSR
jgi:hypothetical protein